MSFGRRTESQALAKRSQVPPNPSLERTSTGKALWPRLAQAWHASSRPKHLAGGGRSAQTLGARNALKSKACSQVRRSGVQVREARRRHSPCSALPTSKGW